jgi:hypothetical protein
MGSVLQILAISTATATTTANLRSYFNPSKGILLFLRARDLSYFVTNNSYSKQQQQQILSDFTKTINRFIKIHFFFTILHSFIHLSYYYYNFMFGLEEGFHPQDPARLKQMSWSWS